MPRTLTALLFGALIQLTPAATEPGVTWDRCYFEPEYATLNAAAVNDTGRIVAVGHGGVIRYSDDDGVTWMTQEPDIHYELRDVHWDGTRFIAVGGFAFETGIVLTSTDGATWNRVCLGSAQQLHCVCSGSATTVTMGNNGRSFTTTDTSSWSGTPSGFDDYFAAVWTGTQFVRVGDDGLIETSPDGTAWTSQVSGTSKNIDGIAWNGSLLVAVGYDSDTGAPLVLTSSDGVGWTPVNMAAFPGTLLRTVTWTGSRFVACGASNQILTSANGTTWASHSAVSNVSIYGLLWTGTHLFAVGERGIILKTDQAAPDDPTDWTVSAIDGEVPAFTAMAQNPDNDRIVAVGSHGTIFYSLNDGDLFSSVTPVTTSTLNDIISTGFAASRRMVAVGNSGTILVSSNGTSWDPDPSGVGAALRGVTYGNFINPMQDPRIIAVGDSGTVLTGEYDPTWAWTDRSASSDTTESLRDVAFGVITTGKPPVQSNLIVAVGLNGTIITSTTGTTWTDRTDPTLTEENLYQVIPMVGGGFMAVGGHGIVLISSNGTDWAHYATGGGRYLHDVTSTGSQYVAVGTHGVVFTSINGDTWTRRYSDTTESLSAALTSSTSGRILAAGSGGVIMYSDPASDFADWIAAESPPPGMDDPEDDPNGDGIDNLTAYGFGIPAVDPPTADDLSRLLRWVDPAAGEPARIRLAPNDSELGDLIYALDWSPSLAPGSWTEIFRHNPGQECGTGEVHIHIMDSGFAEIEIPEAIGFLTNKFYRVRLELIP